MPKPRVIILRTAGTNCDKETAFAFEIAGAEPELVHVNQLARREKDLADYQILAIPGGFTYGDDVASGKILANELKFAMEEDLERFIRAGKPIIGICNGFQVLVKAGLLPNLSGDFRSIEATLTFNDSARFQAEWVGLKRVHGSGNKGAGKCIWTEGMKNAIYLPIAHGEGKFIPADEDIMKQLRGQGLVVFEYIDNPNGSIGNIAGICDPDGRVFGLMPHPERYISRYQHPSWTRFRSSDEEGDGLAIFRNGVNFAKKNL